MNHNSLKTLELRQGYCPLNGSSHPGPVDRLEPLTTITVKAIRRGTNF